MKFCARCRRPATTSPCTDCKRKVNRDRGAPATRGYDDAWVALSRQARARQPWCSTCGATRDLTVDHLVPLAAGGKRTGLTLADVQVLCRSCNSSKGARALPDPTPRVGGEPEGGPSRPPVRARADYTLRLAELLRAAREQEQNGGGIT